MERIKHRVFVSYHHANDQKYKEALIKWSEKYGIFEDWSVHPGDIPDDWDDEAIRVEIRDNYLRSSSVTILLVGTDTWGRKHVDWELYSSMRDSEKNKKSGIVVIMLPSTGCSKVYAAHDGEKTEVFSNIPSDGWHSVSSHEQCVRDYPNLPERIIDQIMAPNAKVSIANWNDIYPYYPERLATLIDNAYNHRESCDYDMSRRMRRRNSN